MNGIFCRIDTKTSPNLLLSLISSFCVPIMLYGFIGIKLSKDMYKAINSSLFIAFGKIFSTYNNLILRQCLFYMDVLTLDLQLNFNKINWFKKTDKCSNMHLISLMIKVGRTEFEYLCDKYNILKDDNRLLPNRR